MAIFFICTRRFVAHVADSNLIIILALFTALAIGCNRSQNESSQQAQRSAGEGDATSASTESDGDSIDRAIRYLMSQQDEDGGWHSEYYGALRGGAANTALILYAFSQLPEDRIAPIHARLVDARSFLQRGIAEHGYVCNDNGSPDYTNYASAMLLIADQRLELGLPTELQEMLVTYLVKAQLGALQEYDQTQVDFGGWDLTGWMQGPKRTAGTNISVSSLAIEALSLMNQDGDLDEPLIIAFDWLEGCHNMSGEGGFYFHPQHDHDGNKAGFTDEQRTGTHPYGTSTCDGLRCLLLLGRPADSPLFQETISWLDAYAVSQQVPGFDHQSPASGWEQGLRYYYYFSYATVNQQLRQISRLDAAGESDQARTTSMTAKHERVANEICSFLESNQRDNGSWKNPNIRMREDDPLIATAFALIALTLLDGEE